MKVELLLADDRELRAAIRELIKAEVLSIARSEIVDILKEVVGDKSVAEFRVNNLIKDVVRERVKIELGGTDYSIREKITQIAREELKPLIRAALKETKLADLV